MHLDVRYIFICGELNPVLFLQSLFTTSIYFADIRIETLPLISLPTHERNIQQNKSMDTFSNDKHKRKRMLQGFF